MELDRFDRQSITGGSLKRERQREGPGVRPTRCLMWKHVDLEKGGAVEPEEPWPGGDDDYIPGPGVRSSPSLLSPNYALSMNFN